MRGTFRSTFIVSFAAFVAFTAPAWSAGTKQHDDDFDHAPHVVAAYKLFKKAHRTMIAPEVAHYSFDVKVGPGELDVVRIHRVVKERRPYKPVRTKDGVFLVHGASLGFDQIFLPSLSSPVPGPGRSFALFLARHGLDVWGIDLGWTKVPVETTSFGFMHGWGVEKDARHTGIALTIARVIRGRTRQGFGKLNLLGFSYGVAIAYAYAGLETERPPFRRNVKGIIPVDLGLKHENESIRITACDSADVFQASIDAGQFQSDQGVLTATLATLAKTAPDDPSPAIPGVTNFQAVMLLMASTHTFGAPSPEPFWHFFGGDFDDSGFPQDLKFSESPFVLDFLSTLPPYTPNQVFLDILDVACDEKDVPFDDHLGEIEVPILYVGAGGGSGAFGEFTTMQTRSSDITSVIVQLLPDDRRFEDFGHGDLFLARKAKRLAWRPILDWILARSGLD